MQRGIRTLTSIVLFSHYIGNEYRGVLGVVRSVHSPRGVLVGWGRVPDITAGADSLERMEGSSMGIDISADGVRGAADVLHRVLQKGDRHT